MTIALHSQTELAQACRSVPHHRLRRESLVVLRGSVVTGERSDHRGNLEPTDKGSVALGKARPVIVRR